MNEFSDEQLLSEFARLRSEGCFAELVRRYVDLVYSVALRLTRNPITAEDVSQAVFIVLAQRAATLAHRPAGGAPLSAWLHLTTRNLATKHIRGEAGRYRLYEIEAISFVSDLAADWRPLRIAIPGAPVAIIGLPTSESYVYSSIDS